MTPPSWTRLPLSQPTQAPRTRDGQFHLPYSFEGELGRVASQTLQEEGGVAKVYVAARSATYNPALPSSPPSSPSRPSATLHTPSPPKLRHTKDWSGEDADLSLELVTHTADHVAGTFIDYGLERRRMAQASSIMDMQLQLQLDRKAAEDRETEREKAAAERETEREKAAAERETEREKAAAERETEREKAAAERETEREKAAAEREKAMKVELKEDLKVALEKAMKEAQEERAGFDDRTLVLHKERDGRVAYETATTVLQVGWRLFVSDARKAGAPVPTKFRNAGDFISRHQQLLKLKNPTPTQAATLAQVSGSIRAARPLLFPVLCYAQSQKGQLAGERHSSAHPRPTAADWWRAYGLLLTDSSRAGKELGKVQEIAQVSKAELQAALKSKEIVAASDRVPVESVQQLYAQLSQEQYTYKGKGGTVSRPAFLSVS
ncbi:hypothetical protein JCM10213_007097 [Rhodosporidiobolus nylandii]